MRRHPATHPRGGQAVIELVVGLVLVLAVTAGLLQLYSLTRADADTMVEARREAGELALLDVAVLSDPPYIEDWEEGADGKRMTADDTYNTANPLPFTQTIVERASPDAAGWALIDSAAEDGMSQLRQNPAPGSVLGLVKGEDSETVTLLPAVRSLIYRADHIEVENEVWLTRLKGIY
jgi:hypothetical protein